MDNTRISYKNVFFKRYVFPYQIMQQVFDDFHKEFEGYGLHENGMYFYGIEKMDRQSDTEATFVMTIYQPAVEEEAPNGCDMEFANMFEYNNLTYRVVSDNYEIESQRAYVDIAMEAQKQGKNIVSPIFNEFFVTKDENGNKKAYCVVKALID